VREGCERRMVLAAAREDGQAGKIGHSGEDESRPRALDAAGQVIATRMPGATVARAARRGRSGRGGRAARAHTARVAAPRKAGAVPPRGRGEAGRASSTPQHAGASAVSAGLPPARASPRAGLP